MFQKDYSSQGGALYIKNLLRANITNSVFRSSVANTGSVYIQDSGVSFSNVIFQNNSAFYCAAVYMERSDVNITTTLLSDNMAHRHAVLCVAYSNLRMGNVSITHNVAKLNGTGGIFAARSTEWNWWYICSPQHCPAQPSGIQKTGDSTVEHCICPEAYYKRIGPCSEVIELPCLVERCMLKQVRQYFKTPCSEITAIPWAKKPLPL